jgi:hypothetical protein
MDASAEVAGEVEQLNEALRGSGSHRHLKLTVLRGGDGQFLIVIGNKSAAVAYPAEPGCPDKFRRDLDNGVFG